MKTFCIGICSQLTHVTYLCSTVEIAFDYSFLVANYLDKKQPDFLPVKIP